MKMSLLTIVIPVYNAEDVLQRSMDSLLNQTVKDFDIVLVDDGSTDSSAKICDKYAKQHKNIRAIHTNNAGTSSAKNRGINVVDTEYVTFCDSDDFYSETFTEDIIKVIKFNSPDCICFGWQYVTKEGVQNPRVYGVPKNQLLNQEFVHKTIIPPLLNLVNDRECFIDDFAWNKVYKTSIINRYQIKFDENRRIWEDRVFVVEYLKYCNSFYCMDKAYYNYVQAEGSLSSKYYLNFFDIVLDSYNKYYKWFGDEYDFDTSYANTHYCHVIENLIFRSLIQTEHTEEIYSNIIRTLQDENVIKWYKNRVPENSDETRLSELVNNKQYDKAIELYRTILQRKQNDKEKRDKIVRLKAKIKRIIKK